MKETFLGGRTELELQKLSIKSFRDIYKEIKSSILPNNSSYFKLNFFISIYYPFLTK